MLLMMLVLSMSAIADTTIKEKKLPAFVVAIAEDAPASDSVLGTNIAVELKKAGYGDLPVSTFKLFKDVQRGGLDGRVILVLYKGEAKIIVGSDLESSGILFATDLATILKYYSVDVGQIMLSKETSSDLISLFEEGHVEDVIITKETVKCVFEDSSEKQECYLDEQNEIGCSGEETCTVESIGVKGTKQVWKSTCGGYAYTVLDGDNEYAEFDCGISIPEKIDLVIKELEFVRKSDKLATIEFDVVNAGLADVKGSFAMAVYINGELTTHTAYHGYDNELDAGESMHRSLSNYYWLNNGEYEITVVVDRFEGGEKDNPVFDGFYDNMVKESNEANNKATISVNNKIVHHTFDLTNYPELFIKNGKFNGYIVVGDNAPASDVISAIDIAQSLQLYDAGEGQIDVGAAKLASEISDPYAMNVISVGNACTNAVSARLLGDKKIEAINRCSQHFQKGESTIRLFNNNGNAQLLVAGYGEADTRYAAKMLVNYKEYDLEGMEVEFNTIFPVEDSVEIEILNIPEPTLYPTTPGEVSPSLPVTATCNNGCLLEDTCLPFGTRLVDNEVAKYCAITKELVEQQAKEAQCQNNYECSTNQCNDGACGSLSEELEETRGMLKQVMNWLSGWFN